MSGIHEKEQSIGRITSGIERENALAIRTIDFVSQQLPAWRDDPDRHQEEAEDRLNLQLCKFLDSRARNEFPMVRFDHEEYQTGRHRVDLSASPVESTTIGVKLHTVYDPILVFECKRLPAPTADREKEYVTGGEDLKSGGLQRFKLGLHGANLSIAAMVGYVQGQSSCYWHERINRWISELVSGAAKDTCEWSSGEVLGPLEEYASKGISRCRSIHSRGRQARGKEILIYHLWVAMTTRN